MSFRLKLKDLGDIGNIIAALGVIASLLVVAWEIRGNTKVLYADARLQMVQMNRQSLDWLRDPSFAELLARANEGVSRLEGAERSQFFAYTAGIFDQWEQGYLSHRDGLMEDSVWHGWNQAHSDQSRRRGFQEAWTILKPYYSEEFQLHVEQTQTVQ